MKKALVLTVGTGTRPDSDIVQPLAKTIRNSRPDRIVFIVSAESAQHAQQIQKDLDLGDRATDRMIDQPDDVEHVFQSALDGLRALRGEGFAADEIDADYTSGTKAMTAGLVLAAVAFGCGSLKFITGRREHGVVVAGTERFLSIPPVAVLAHQKVEIALELFRALQFEAIRHVLPGKTGHVLDDYDERLLSSLRHLGDAYKAWDQFQHGGFKTPYKEADATLVELAAFRVPESIVERLQIMHGARQQLNLKKKITEDLLADLWNNAERRRREGKSDDAVARLYRLTEMLAQYELLKTHDVDTSDIALDPISVSDDLKRRLEAQRQKDRKVQVGLQAGYEILHELGSPLATEFLKRNMGELLGVRNLSILAHGQQPIDPADAERLAHETRGLALIVIGDFAARCRALQFPWLHPDVS